MRKHFTWLRCFESRYKINSRWAPLASFPRFCLLDIRSFIKDVVGLSVQRSQFEEEEEKGDPFLVKRKLFVVIICWYLVIILSMRNVSVAIPTPTPRIRKTPIQQVVQSQRHFPGCVRCVFGETLWCLLDAVFRPIQRQSRLPNFHLTTCANQWMWRNFKTNT